MATPTLVFGDKTEIYDGASALNFGLAVLSASKVAITYHHDQDYGRAKIGTIDGFDQTWGSEYEYVDPNGTVSYSYCCALGEDRIIPVWRAPVDFDGQAIIGLVDGTSIDYGAQTEFTDGYLLPTLHKVRAIDESTAVIAYRGYQTTGSGVAVVAKTSGISGTVLSFGTPVVFADYDIQELKIATIGESGIIIGYERNDNNYVKAIVGAVSGTTISFGSEADIVAAGAGSNDTDVSVLNDNKAVVVYRDGTDGSHGTAKIVSISGTMITDVGSEYEWANHVCYHIASATFDETYFAVSYIDWDDGLTKHCALGTVRGTTIDWGTGVQYGGFLATPNAESFVLKRLDPTHLISVYRDGSNGSATVIELSGLPSTTSLVGRPIDWLLKTSDHNPQIIGALDGATSANIQVWGVTNGQNNLVDITSSGCYQIGDTGRWAWSTINLPIHTAYEDQYFYRMIADNDETFAGQFFMQFPETIRSIHPDMLDGYVK